MYRYQLRMSKDQNINKLVDAMVDHAWFLAREHFDFRKIQPEDFSDFKEQTRRSLQPFLTTFDRCGTALECADEVEGAPMLSDEDRIYHLFIPKNFSDFLKDISNAGYRSIKHLALPGQASVLLQTIERAFRRRLNKHIYFNPVCGNIDLCHASQRINPWSHQGG